MTRPNKTEECRSFKMTFNELQRHFTYFKPLKFDFYIMAATITEAKGKDKNRYQELKAGVQRKLRLDKQLQLEGMCVELEAANLKRKLQVALPDSQINDSKVPVISSMYPVSDWRKFD